MKMDDSADIVEKPTGNDPVKQRRERIAIGIVAAVVLVLTLLEANLATIGSSVRYSGNIIIFALINTNVILIVLLIFLVTRNVFKMILDRRRKILGSRIRTRLVLMFTAFSLIPTTLLFITATNITTTNIRSWIGGRVGVALTDALEIARKGLDGEALVMLDQARILAPAISAALGNDNGVRTLAPWLGADNTISLVLLKDGRVLGHAGPVGGQIIEEIASRLKGETLPGPGKNSRTFIGDSYASGAIGIGEGRILVAIKTIPPEQARRIRSIAEAYDEYHQVRLLDDPIRASYIAILILITLLIMFAATWMGIYLARQITVPVQLMAEGTRRVAGGDLDVHLDYVSDDEFGYLVSSFNRMISDLKDMKKNLEEAHNSLSTTYDELKRRTQFIETILTNISTAVVVLDRYGRIAMINRVAEKLLGVTDGFAVGKPYREVLLEEHYETVRVLSREIGSAGTRQIVRQVELPVEGKRISLRISLTNLKDEDGGHLGTVVAFDDLSQTMKLQKVLAWREVARRIAHEIRNPLTPIQLSAERLQKRYGASHADDPAFGDCTQTILSEVAILKLLMEEFTRFARMPAPALTEGNLGEEFRSTIETFRDKYPEISWDYRCENVSSILFDAFQMRRALTNLLENAAAALGGHGHVVVTCERTLELDWVRVSVADDGPGVNPQDRDHLFEPYFSRKPGGTGLGLAIVSAIANDHGGTVSVRSNEPAGAIFEMEFPGHQRG
ncbi:MAG TPA: ATP-binding protein [Candidatus Deferrimicrobiaceae bacterium]|jgi:two-component system nitrogen regulation sensor histidine kinase NtrY